MTPAPNFRRILIADPFEAGVFVAVVQRHIKDGYRDAMGLTFRAATHPSGGFEIRFNRPISEILYQATILEVASFCSRVRTGPDLALCERSMVTS